MTGYKISRKIDIKADSSKVWDALTNPEIIKQYLFGTDAVSEWKTGSDIIFQGEYNGVKYRDKGNILAIEDEKLFKYSYWSGFSGLEDKEENYSVVTYSLDKKGGTTSLHLTQENIASKEAMEHSDKNWGIVLDKLKTIVEQG